MKISFRVLVSTFFITTIFSCAITTSESTIGMDEFKKLYSADSKIYVIDVRTEGEFNGPLGHIPSSTLMPLSNINETVNILKEANSGPVYVVCRSGNRSGKATSILRKNGINAINVQGGMKAWNQ